MLDAWAARHILAYLSVVVLPAYPLYVVGKVLWRQVVSCEGGDPHAAAPLHRTLPPFLVGVVERPLYLAAFLEGQPEFIGVWLAIKVAGGWSGWVDGMKVPRITPTNDRKTTKDDGDEQISVPGRLMFNISLASSGLSVLHALGVAKAVELASGHEIRTAIFVAAVPFALTTTVGVAARLWRAIPRAV